MEGRYCTAVIDFIEPSSGMVWVFPPSKLMTTESAVHIALDENMRMKAMIILKIFICVIPLIFSLTVANC